MPGPPPPSRARPQPPLRPRSPLAWQRVLIFLPIFLSVVCFGGLGCCISSRYKNTMADAADHAEAAWARLGARATRRSARLGRLHAGCSFAQVRRGGGAKGWVGGHTAHACPKALHVMVGGSVASCVWMCFRSVARLEPTPTLHTSQPLRLHVRVARLLAPYHSLCVRALPRVCIPQPITDSVPPTPLGRLPPSHSSSPHAHPHP